MTSVREWLEGLALGQYADAFEAEQIELRALTELTESDLKDMGLPIGPRRIVLKAARERDDGPGAAHRVLRQGLPGNLSPSHSLAKPSAARSRSCFAIWLARRGCLSGLILRTCAA